MPHVDPGALQDTPAGRLVRRWLGDHCLAASGETEEETANRCDRLTDTLESLVKRPASNWADADGKFLVLTALLRRAATAADPETMLIALLAAGIQDDLRRLRL